MFKKAMDELLKKLQLDNQKIILILLLFIIIAYIDYSFLIKMQVSNIKAVKPKIAKLKGDIEVLNKSLAESKKAGQQQNPHAKSYLRMISNDQLPMLLEEMSNMAKSNNVLLMQVRQVKETKKKEEKQAQTNDLAALYIALDLSGSYHDFGRFINGLENADKFIAVQDMNIKQQPADPLLQNANLLLKIYVKK